MEIWLRAEKCLMRVSYSRHVDGLWLGSLGGKGDEHLLCRVEDALTLIKNFDPLRYARIRRDVERIWINQRIGAIGTFNFTLKLCYLDRKFVETSAVESIASTIVHEATHGHPCLRKFGYPEALRYRIEQICMKQELAFACLLPDSKLLREQIGRSLAMDPSYWLEKEFAARRPVQELEAARAAGIPDWLTKSILRTRNFCWRIFRSRP